MSEEPELGERPELAGLVGHAARAAGAVGCTAVTVDVLARRPGRVVARVRGADDDGSGDVVVKVAAGPGAFAAEAAANAVLRGAGVPVNDLLRHEAGPPGVLVARWVEGSPVTSGSPPGVLAEVGRVLAAVHALPAEAPYSGNPTLVAWIDGWVRHALSWWVGCPGVTADQVRAAERWWWAEVRPLVEGRAGATMLLDGRPDHLLVGGGGGGSTDGGVRLIDVADLQSGDPVMDLAVLELHEPGVLRGVVPAWGHAEVGPEHLAELVPFYVLLRALAAAEWHLRVGGDQREGERWLGVADTAVSAKQRSRPRPPDAAAGA